DALSNQAIAFASRLHETAAIEDRDLAPAALDQPGALQFARRIGDAGPLDAEHVRQQVLGYRQYIAIGAVPHHQKPAREPALEVMPAVAGHRHLHLLEERLDVGVHEIAETGYGFHRPREGVPRHQRCAAWDL